MKNIFTLVSMILTFFLIAAVGWADEPSTKDPGEFMPNQLIIGFKHNVSNTRINKIVKNMGGRIAGRFNLPKVKIRLISIPAVTEDEINAKIALIKNSNEAVGGQILYTEQNGIERAFKGNAYDSQILSQSADPLLTDQWGYYDCGADKIQMPFSVAPKVAVIDTGVDYNHPDLKGRVIKGRDFVNNDNDPMDDNGHGTHVSGVIAANPTNQFGITGVSWKSKIVAVKVLSSEGWGTTFDVAAGIRYAANKAGVKVISMSLGGGGSLTERAAVEYAVLARNRLLVAAAGNDDSDVKSYPAGYATDYPGRVIAVAAHGPDHCKASFSNYGPWVSISAPGVDILSTLPPNNLDSGYSSWNGTSMATPFVSGAAAVLWAEHRTWTNAQIGDHLMNYSAESYDPLLRDDLCWPNDGATFGRLSIENAVEESRFTNCEFGDIIGNAMDAESGDPLAGATVYTKQGRTRTGTDVVPWWGSYTHPFNQTLITEGPGLFSITAYPGGANHDLQLVKRRYARPVFSNITVPACSSTDVGLIPIPPNKRKYFIVITWEDPAQDYDLWAKLPNQQYIYWGNPGNLNASPWARYFWDSFYADGLLRQQSETIRILKTLPGQTKLFVDDSTGELYSTNWSTSGIQVFLYKWSSGLKLVQQFSPASGSGEYWHIADISGNTVTVQNFINDTMP